VMELGSGSQWSSATSCLECGGEESWEGINAGDGGGGVAPLLSGRDGGRRPVGDVNVWWRWVFMVSITEGKGNGEGRQPVEGLRI
jgi:hypothetical protein